MPFDSDFERDILAKAAKDGVYREQARRVIGDHDFTDKHHAWVWKLVAELPTEDRLNGSLVVAAAKRDFSDEEDRDEYMGATLRILKHEPAASSAALKELNRFRRYNSLTGGMSKALKKLDKGEVEDAADILDKVLRDKGEIQYQFTDWIEDFEKRQKRREHLRDHPEERICIPTKIDTLDLALDGGIEGGELALIVGTTGRGKSHFAVHLAFWAAAQGFRTLFVSTEMNEEQVSVRFDAKLLSLPATQVKMYDHNAADLDMIKGKLSRVSAKLARKLRIAVTPIRKANIQTLDQMLDDMEAEGDPAQLIVVDCADHVKPIDWDKEFRLRQANTFWDLKSIMEERNIGGWATTQAPKEVVNKIASAENVSEAYDKARIADVIWTLNATQAEERMGKQRGFLAKRRQGRSKILVPMKVDLARSHFEHDKDAKPPGEGGPGEEEDE